MPQDDSAQAQTTRQAGGIPLPPNIEAGSEVYDRIMGGIEPELTNAQMPLLAEKYQDETPEQATARAQRYQKAFEEYDRQYAAYLENMDAQVRSFEKGLIDSVEQDDRGGDQSSITGIEAQMNAI